MLQSAWIVKSGTLIAFGFSSSVPGESGQCPLAPVTAIGGTPTVSRNGTPIVLTGPAWQGSAKDTAVVFYLLDQVAVPEDVFTYDAPIGWATTDLGAAAQVTAGAVDNWTGRLEGASGAFGTFAVTPTLLAGVNVGAQPSGSGFSCTYTTLNRFMQGSVWTAVNCGITYDADAMPASWNNPIFGYIYRWLYGTDNDNTIDAFRSPSQWGEWSFAYVDPDVNTTSAAAVWLGSGQTNAYINQSGPHTGTTTASILEPADVAIGGGSVTSLTVASSTLGTGWQAAIVQITGGGGSDAVAVPIVSGGVITGLHVVCFGSGYTSKPTVTIYGLALSGTTVSGVMDVTYPGDATWWDLDIAFHVAQTAGIYNLSKVCVTAPDAETHAAVPIPADDPLATDPSVLSAFTGGSNTINHMRFMDATQGYGGTSGGIDAADRLDSTVPNWTLGQDWDVWFQFARHFNTDPGDSTYAWSSTKVYGPQAIFADGPDGFGRYIPLPTTDNGAFTANGGQAYQTVVIELRSTTPHGLTGCRPYDVFCASDGVTVPVTNTTGNFAPTGLNGGTAFVTGPNTVLVNCYIPSLITGGTSGSLPQTVASTSEIDLTAGGSKSGWLITYSQPRSCVPYDYTARMAAQLDSLCWVNISTCYADELAYAIGQEIGAYAPGVLLELGNEPWNGSTVMSSWPSMVDHLMGYLSPGTSLLGGYMTTEGRAPGGGGSGTLVAMAANAADRFRAGYVAAGGVGGNVKLLFNCQYSNVSSTWQALESAQAAGAPLDYIAVAPYFDCPYDASMVDAFATWPVSALNDMLRHWVAYRVTHQSYWQSLAEAVNAYGNPTTPIFQSDSGMSGGLLAGGAYTVYITYQDADGNETTVGNSGSNQNGYALGQVPRFVMPMWPAWAATMNIYLADGGPANWYASVSRAQYADTQGPGSFVHLSAAMPPETRTPPGTNQAAAHTPIRPRLITYEGGIESIIPSAVTGRNLLAHDSFAHPSYADVVWCWYAACQVGCQTMIDGGAVMATYYQAYQHPDYGATWFLSFGSAHPPGQGLANRYATAQGGSPADGHDHMGGPNGNEATGLYGLQRWIAASPPAGNTGAHATSTITFTELARAGSNTGGRVTCTFTDTAHAANSRAHANDTATFTAVAQAASSSGSKLGQATGTLTFTDAAATSDDLGRYRRGDIVVPSLATPGVPDSAPIAVVLDAGNTQVALLPMPAVGRDLTTFGVRLFLGPGFNLGSFRVYIHYTIGGVSTVARSTFDVVDGGDPGGSVISLHGIDRPEARSIIAQLASGRLVVGSNPGL